MAAAIRWVPWVCAYTGARGGEITQLRAEDVKRHRQGFWTITITPEAGTVKTGQARTVPVHEHLVARGSIEFVRGVALALSFTMQGVSPQLAWPIQRSL